MSYYHTKFLINLYRKMLEIRLLEESLVDPIIKGDIKTPCHLYSGQEAIAVGVCSALNKNDLIFGNHRSHGHYLAKGGDLSQLVAEIYCKETGCCKGRGGSMHVVSPEVGMLGAAPIVAGTISIALGAALAFKMKKEKRVVVSFFGDGATGEGVLYESLNFAALKKLPIIFACENNYYSTHMPINECRSNNDIYKIGISFGIPSYRIEGNDVLKVYEISRKAIKISREGNGPVFIQFDTYRLRGHVGPDDNIQGKRGDIRPKEEKEYWAKKDPIIKMENFLIRKKILDKKMKEKILLEVNRLVNKAHSFAINSPKPDKKEVTKYVFKKQEA